jgi:hypothetical protein
LKFCVEKGDLTQVREVIKKLPLCHKETLRVLCEHFATVSAVPKQTTKQQQSFFFQSIEFDISLGKIK